MKIHPDQLKALQELEQAQKGKKPQPDNGFEQILKDSLGQEEPAADRTQDPPDTRTSLSQIHASMQTTPARSSQPESGKPLMEEIDSVLSQWENYSRQLASPRTTLRETYATLQSIHRDLERAQQKLSEADNAPPQLSSILNELNVLVQTEEIKINRGDYLAGNFVSE